MAAFGGSDASSAGADAAGPMEWDDVDAFLDDYLKADGAAGPDMFGNFGIDFAGAGAPPVMLGAGGWGGPPSMPLPGAAPVPLDSGAGSPTLLTGRLQAQALDSQAAATTLQPTGSDGATEAAPPAAAPRARATRARATRAAAPAATAAAAAAAAAVPVPDAPAPAPSTAGTTGGRGGGSASGASRGSRETKKEVDMKKHLALQEKNRRAQRRFRERQKQRVAELEAQVAALQAQLEGERSARGAAAPQQQQAPSSAATQSAPSADTGMQHDGGSSGGLKQEQPSPRAVVGAQLCSSSPPCSDEEAAGALPAGALDEALTLTVRGEGFPMQLTGRQLADMTPAELARHYKAYVNELAGILVESDNPSAGATQGAVKRLVDEACLLTTRAALCNPPGAKHFALTKVDDVPGQPADARVPQIARALDVSPQQRRQLGQLRGLYLQKLGRIAAERQELNSQLLGAVPGGTSGRAQAGRYLAAHEAGRRLRESLREEHVLSLDFASTINKHVLSAQQVAQFMIQSYPWTPDCLALCTWVAAEDGDAEALSMLAAEAQSKQAAAAAAAAAAAGTTSSGGSGNTQLRPPMFSPTAFAGMGVPAAFGLPAGLPGGGAYSPLMHAPGGGGAAPMGGLPWGASSSQQSGMPQLHMGHAACGCLPVPAGLSSLASDSVQGGAAAKASSLLGELHGGCIPISPHTMSSAAHGL